MATATGRLSPPAATFSPVSTLPFPFTPPLAKLGLGFFSLLSFPSSPPSLFSPCGFLVSEHSVIRRPPPRILLDLRWEHCSW
uniref:Uncharacterized protein n=1 Tax=Oryza nivara TaxID=4536 RepID=A0A0E0G3I7_ORYNI